MAYETVEFKRCGMKFRVFQYPRDSRGGWRVNNWIAE